MGINKICKVCKEEKPATAEYFHRAKRERDGLRPDCIICRTGKPRCFTKGIARSEAVNRRARRQTLRGYLADSLCNSIRGRCISAFGYPSDLTVGYLLKLWEEQDGRCYWTGLKLTYGDDLPRAHVTKISFDRLEGDIGYMQGNVVLASNFANRGRGNLPPDEFRAFLDSLGLKI